MHKVLMDAGYETARLMLDPEPALSARQREIEFLEYAVKGRNLEQLNADFLELSQNADKKRKQVFTEAFLVGWGSNHGMDQAINHVQTHVSELQSRQNIYHRLLQARPDAVIDRMMVPGNRGDFDLMMERLVAHAPLLKPEQITRFVRRNTDQNANAWLLRSLKNKPQWGCHQPKIIDGYIRVANLTDAQTKELLTLEGEGIVIRESRIEMPVFMPRADAVTLPRL